MSNFSVSAVPADGLAPLGARASAGAVMTKYGTFVYTKLYWIYEVSGLDEDHIVPWKGEQQ